MSGSNDKPWTFVTNHTRVLIAISENPDIRVRDIAQLAGITERSAQRIVADLESGGYLTHQRVGRRNRYSINHDATLRHQRERDIEIGRLIDVLKPPSVGHRPPTGSASS